MTTTLHLQTHRDISPDDEEFDEADMWGDEGSADESEGAAQSSDDEEENGAVVEEDGFASSRSANIRRFEVLQPAAANPIAGSLPNWQSSLPRPIMHPKAEKSVAGVGAAAGNVSKDGVDIAVAAASLPDPGPGFIPPHIYASTYSTYSSTAAGGLMDAYLNGNGQGVAGGGIGSCVSGRGHTLKGRDAIKMRSAILRQTGFVEPNTPGSKRYREPRTSSPAIVVAGDVAGRENFDDHGSP